MEKIKEGLFKPESEKEYQSRIQLDFFRHSLKENAFSDDEKNPLSPEGRQLARSQAQPNVINQAVAFGGPRERAQHTAMLKMAGVEQEITGEETYEELKKKLNNALEKGVKIKEESSLDMSDDFSGPFGAKVAEHWFGENYLSFIVNDSNRLAEELGDKTSIYTYSRLCSRVATFIQKYFKVAPIWDKLIQQEKYPSNVLFRFFGSHGGMLEPFLLKVIEVIKGKTQRDLLIKLLDDESFIPTEGFKIFIDTKPSGLKKVIISYHKEQNGQTIFHFEEEIPIELINQLAKGESKK